MASACLVSLLLDSLLLLQVFPFGVHDFHVFAAIDKTTSGTCQNAPLVTRPSRLTDRPRSGVLEINVWKNALLGFEGMSPQNHA